MQSKSLAKCQALFEILKKKAMWTRVITLISLLVFFAQSSAMPEEAQDASNNVNQFRQSSPLQTVSNWHKLMPFQTFGENYKLTVFKFQTKNGSSATLAVIDLTDPKLKVIPFFNSKLATTSSIARANAALVAINGGFFNLSNGESTSYVVINGQQQCEPKKNRALITNPKLAPYLNTIFNRSELRIFKDASGQAKIMVAKHNDPIPDNCRLEGSLQGGPELLPTVGDVKEAFVRTQSDGTDFDSIGSRKHAARTACGITPDGHLMLLCIGTKGQDEFSSGVTLQELSNTLKELGCDQALNFDGGTSTTMVVSQSGQDNNDHNHDYVQVCGRTPEKLVKSGLMIEPLDL